MLKGSFLRDKEKANRSLLRGKVQWRDRVVNNQWFRGQSSQRSVPGLTRSRVELATDASRKITLPIAHNVGWHRHAER